SPCVACPGRQTPRTVWPASWRRCPRNRISYGVPVKPWINRHPTPDSPRSRNALVSTSATERTLRSAQVDAGERIRVDSDVGALLQILDEFLHHHPLALVLELRLERVLLIGKARLIGRELFFEHGDDRISLDVVNLRRDGLLRGELERIRAQVGLAAE